MEDKCEKPDQLSVKDIFDSTNELMEKMGASETCKKVSNSWGQNNATSGNMYAKGSMEVGYGAAKADAEVGAGFQNSASSYQRAMSEAGCGTYVVNATKQSTNIQKINCIIQKAQNKSEVGVSGSNTVVIKTKKLSEEEIADKKRILLQIQSAKRPSIQDYKDFKTEDIEKLMFRDQQNFDKGIELLMSQVEKAYGRNITLTDSSINQTITGKIEIITGLNSTEIQNIENITKSMAKNEAQQATEQTAGVDAMTPNTRSVINTTIETNENISGTAINSKIQDIYNNIKVGNVVEIIGDGNITLDRTKIDQKIALDVAVKSIISSSIQAGVKAASEIISDNTVIQSLKTESKGIEAIIEAQGKANAAAIQAGKVGPFGSTPTFGFGVIIIIVAIIYLSGKVFSKTIDKFLMIILAILVLFFILAVIIAIANINALSKYFRSITGNKTLEDKENEMKRSIKLYNKIWTSFGCTNELTYDDIMILGVENVDNLQVYDFLESYFKLCLVPGAKESDIKRCFKEGKVPDLFLPLIKLKNPKDLSDVELRKIWDNYCKFVTYFSDFLQEWNEHKKIVEASQITANKIPFKYITYGNVAAAINKYAVNKILLKIPSRLSQEDIQILWSKYGICKEPPSGIIIDEYKKLPSMNDVKIKIMSCKLDPRE